MSKVLTLFLWNKFISCNRRLHCLQTLFFVFKFATSETKESFVTRSNALLVDTRLRAVSLFSWSVEQNARDTQITTRVTEGARHAASPLNARPRVHSPC